MTRCIGLRPKPKPKPDGRCEWYCPDCGQPCLCTDPLVRAAPHVRCGKRPPVMQ